MLAEEPTLESADRSDGRPRTRCTTCPQIPKPRTARLHVTLLCCYTGDTATHVQLKLDPFQVSCSRVDCRRAVFIAHLLSPLYGLHRRHA